MPPRRPQKPPPPPPPQPRREDLTLSPSITRGIEEERRAQAEAAAKREEEDRARAEAEAAAVAERVRKQALYMRGLHDQVAQLVARIIHGDVRVEDIDPELLRHPQALRAIDLAQGLRAMTQRHLLDGFVADGARLAMNIANDDRLEPKVRLQAVATVAAIAKTSKRPDVADDLRKLMAAASSTSGNDLRNMSDDALTARVRALLEGDS